MNYRVAISRIQAPGAACQTQDYKEGFRDAQGLAFEIVTPIDLEMAALRGLLRKIVTAKDIAMPIEMEDEINAMLASSDNGGWQSIETAPKGGGALRVTDPKWVEPPLVMLRFNDGKIAIGKWDWYYAEGGNGYTDGLAWVDELTGEVLSRHYGAPTFWMDMKNIIV